MTASVEYGSYRLPLAIGRTAKGIEPMNIYEIRCNARDVMDGNCNLEDCPAEYRDAIKKQIREFKRLDENALVYEGRCDIQVKS